MLHELALLSLSPEVVQLNDFREASKCEQIVISIYCVDGTLMNLMSSSLTYVAEKAYSVARSSKEVKSWKERPRRPPS